MFGSSHSGKIDSIHHHLILAIFYPSLQSIVGCFGMFLKAKKVNIHFTELAERVEYGNYAHPESDF